LPFGTRSDTGTATGALAQAPPSPPPLLPLLPPLAELPPPLDVPLLLAVPLLPPPLLVLAPAPLLPLLPLLPPLAGPSAFLDPVSPQAAYATIVVEKSVRRGKCARIDPVRPFL
jgi:hypothetical protein